MGTEGKVGGAAVERDLPAVRGDGREAAGAVGGRPIGGGGDEGSPRPSRLTI